MSVRNNGTRRVPAGAALTPQQQFPGLPPGLARFAAGIKLKEPPGPPRSKRGIGALEPGLEKFAAGVKFKKRRSVK